MLSPPKDELSLVGRVIVRYDSLGGEYRAFLGIFVPVRDGGTLERSVSARARHSEHTPQTAESKPIPNPLKVRGASTTRLICCLTDISGYNLD